MGIETFALVDTARQKGSGLSICCISNLRTWSTCNKLTCCSITRKEHQAAPPRPSIIPQDRLVFDVLVAPYDLYSLTCIGRTSARGLATTEFVGVMLKFALAKSGHANCQLAVPCQPSGLRSRLCLLINMSVRTSAMNTDEINT